MKRNTLYSARLSLTWDGLLWRADGWTIDAGGITDGRRLVLSSSEDSHLEINSLGKLKRSSARRTRRSAKKYKSAKRRLRNAVPPRRRSVWKRRKSDLSKSKRGKRKRLNRRPVSKLKTA